MTTAFPLNSVSLHSSPWLDSPAMGLIRSRDLDVRQMVILIAPADCTSILWTVMQSLPPSLDAAIMILIHGTSGEDGLLETKLNRGRFPVEVGQVGTLIRNGHAVLLHSGSRLAIKEGALIEGSDQPKILERLLRQYGSGAFPVVLTELDALEAESLAPSRSRGQSLALDDTERGWLMEKVPKVVPDPRDICLPAESIGGEILRTIALRSESTGQAKLI